MSNWNSDFMFVNILPNSNFEVPPKETRSNIIDPLKLNFNYSLNNSIGYLKSTKPNFSNSHKNTENLVFKLKKLTIIIRNPFPMWLN